MSEVFLTVLNMSIAASWMILAVTLLRFVLKSAPKWIAVLLWGISAFRLAVPFSVKSVLSLVPSAETFDIRNIRYETPAIRSGISAVNNAVNPVLSGAFAPNPGGSVNPLYVWTLIASVIWIAGIAAMMMYALISYVRVHRSVAERLPYEGNIFLCDNVKSPFILGVIKPKIYLPSNMDAIAMDSVIAHEKAHLARRDHWWKPMGFLILTIHWFNPMCWIAYALLCRDIELACDEKVIRQMDLDGKKQYSDALLECSTGRRMVTVCPLAFGEVGVKKRVINVLNYKKPAFWVIAAAVIACAAVTVCFATNPKEDFKEEYILTDDVLREKYPEYFELGTFKGLEVYVWQMAENSYRFGLMQGTNRNKTMEELMALKGVSAEEMAAILSAFDIDDKSIFVIPWQNPISSYTVPEEMMKNPEYISNIRAMLGLDGAAAGTAKDTALSTLSQEQTAIKKAILGHNRSADTPADILSCCSFVTLETVVRTSAGENNVGRVTYYGWALYEEYKVTPQGPENVSGSHIPVALTFEYDEFGYSLLEYWEPRDGSYYVQDIRKKFPPHIAEDGIDSQKFILLQEQECYAQAAEYFGLDTGKVIGALIETICESPAYSSNPGDYIDEHPIEYRAMTYYGRYTLKYCFSRFEKGGETGLEGHIMKRACEEIAAALGERVNLEIPAETGQEWYDAVKQNALNLTAQYTETELAERCPASYLLLGMLGKM